MDVPDSLHSLFHAEGITPSLLIDQLVLSFSTQNPVPARTAHTVVRKVLGQRATYGYVCSPTTDEERQRAAYKHFAVALHDPVPNKRLGFAGFNMHQLKTLSTTLAPGAVPPTITYSEITLDCFEKTPLSSWARAQLGLAFILRSAAAVGMAKIKGSNKKGEAPRTFKAGDTDAIATHIASGFSVFIKDGKGRKLKVYIKTSDTERRFNNATGKFETVVKAPLPTHLHRLRIEWTFTGDPNPIKTLDDLLDLKPLAKLFYVNRLGLRSAKATSMTLKPARPGYRRKKPKDATADTQFNRWIRGAARSFKLAESNTEKGACRSVLETSPTEGTRHFCTSPTLITSEALSSPLSPQPAQRVVGSRSAPLSSKCRAPLWPNVCTPSARTLADFVGPRPARAQTSNNDLSR